MKGINHLHRDQSCPCCSFDLFLPPATSEPSSEETASTLPFVADGDEPMSPERAAACIAGLECVHMIVDTHGHAHLDKTRNQLYAVKETVDFVKLKSITCAVAADDWKDTLDFAAKSDATLPALGIHPWYLDGLPENWLQQLEALLREHPSALVGEIGLCKMARFVRQHPQGKSAALAMQRSVFKKQMLLAAKLRRPVSVHCVNQHGVFLSVIKELFENQPGAEPPLQLPPAIGMHSFTGTAHHIKELIGLERDLDIDEPVFYFGFSHSVNYSMCTSTKARQKGRDAVCAVPMDRLLVESDVHSAGDLLGGTAGAIAYVAWARNASIAEVAINSAKNGMQFVASGLKN